MAAPLTCIEHITLEGQRWDTLAWIYYGNPLAYGRILAANPLLDMDSTLAGGQVVLVPVLALAEVQAAQAARPEDVPPWKR